MKSKERLTNISISLGRFCFTCGSNETYIEKNGKHHWYLNHDSEDNALCSKCYSRYFDNPSKNKKWNPINRAKILTFKGRNLKLGSNPRIGVCNLCRAVRLFDCKRTAMHHDEGRYDDNNPLRYTIESCPRCHAYETWRLGQIGEGLL